MGNETKWTKGPWHVPKARGYAHGPVDKNDVPVVTWTGMARPRQENGMANAHLIAAAPDMAGAIEWALAVFGPDTPEHAAILEAMHSALSKARGEQS